MSRRQVLIWKYEDGPEDAPDEGDLNDVGPAWLDTYDGDQHVSAVSVAGGDWITRAEAHRLAEANGYQLELDEYPRPSAVVPRRARWKVESRDSSNDRRRTAPPVTSREPKLLVALPTEDVAFSLLTRLHAFGGEKGMSIGQPDGSSEVTMMEFPNTREELEDVLGVVKDWLARTVGLDSVTVHATTGEFEIRRKQS